MRLRHYSLPMKFAYTLAALVILVGFPLHAQLPFTYETDQVLTSAGEFLTNDGRTDLVIVEKTTGILHFGIQNADSTLSWVLREPSGIPNPTSLAVARFGGGITDRAAITSPAANRVTLAHPAASFSQVLYQHIFPQNPLPQALAPFDPDNNGIDDLFIAGDRANGTGQPFYYEFRSNLAAANSLTWQTQFNQPTHRVFRFVPKTSATPVLGEIFGSQFYRETPTTTGVINAQLLTGVSVNASTLMTYGPFSGTALQEVILYTPGQTTAKAAKFTEPTLNTFQWAAATTLTFPKPIKQLTTILAPPGARLGVLFVDQTAAIYTYNGTTLTLRSNLTTTANEWLNPLGSEGLFVKHADGYARFNTASTSPTLAPYVTGAFPASTSTSSNLVFFNEEPLVSPTALPIAFAKVRDWSTASTTSNGTLWTITAGNLGANGISVPTPSSYTSPSTATHTLLNQINPATTFFQLAPAVGSSLPELFITPPSGNQNPGEIITVNFSPSLANHSVRYRTGSGAWLIYNPGQPPQVSSNATISAYAFGPNGNSAIRSVTYTFATPPAPTAGTSLDLDLDGMPDAWEKAFNLTDPTADSDEDDTDNLTEFLNGTDPQDSSDFPAPGEFILHYEIVQSPGQRSLVLIWSTQLGVGPVLESSATLLPGSWQAITNNIQIDGGNYKYFHPLPLNGTPARFFRLRRDP